MKKHFILLGNIILLLLPVNYIIGCGFSLYAEDYRFYLLQPDVAQHREITPFFYTANKFYDEYGISYSSQSKMREVNSKEWQTYSKYKGSWKDISNMMYDIPAELFVNRIDSITAKQPFLQLLKKTNKAGYSYFNYARQCELMINTEDKWGFEKYKLDTTLANNCLKQGLKQYKQTNSDFLKIRLAYQLLKLRYYNGFGDSSCLSIYENQIKNVSINSWIKESARFYCLEDLATSPSDYQYQLSLTFDNSIDKRFRCVQLFNQKNTVACLLKTKNNHEKATLYIMSELQNPSRSLDAIKHIYDLDNMHKDLSMLLIREINKLEDWIYTPELTGQSPSIFENMYDETLEKILHKNNLADKNYLQAVYNFVQKIIEDGKRNDLAFLHIVSNHISLLKNDVTRAEWHLKQASRYPLDNQLQFQLHLNTVLVRFISNQKMTPETEQLLLDFEIYNKQHPDIFINQQTMMHQLYLFVGKKLLHNGDVAKGICMLSKTNRVIGTIGYWSVSDFYDELLEHAKPKDYDDVLTLLSKQKKSTFESYLSDRHYLKNVVSDERYIEGQWSIDTFQLNKNKILDFKSIYYIRHDKLDSALLCVNQIPECYWNEWPYQLFQCFPFRVCNSTDYQSNHDFYVYNKRRFLQRMCNLKLLIDNHYGDIAKYEFILATGYFNMSYHGNYWIMNNRHKLSDEVSNEGYLLDKANTQFYENYYGCKLAQTHYLNALRNTKNKEFGALCVARANDCNVNLQEIHWRLNNMYDEKKYDWLTEFLPNYDKFITLFTEMFPNETGFYDDYVSNCYYNNHLDKKYY
jgi:hypothetical protein